MVKQAKIILSADIASIKQKTDEAKQLLNSIGQTKVDNRFAREFSDSISKELEVSAKKLETEINGVKTALKNAGREGKKAFSSDDIKDRIRSLSEMQRRYNDIKNILRDINKEEESSNKRGTGKRMLSGGMRAAGALGVSFGVGSLYRTQQQVSDQRLKVRALSGGVDDTRSGLGFTKSERRQRQLEIAGAAGRNLESGDLKKIVDIGEKAERAYGVTGQAQAGLMGAARRAGAGGQEAKLVSESIGTAVAAKLTGSRIGEFLQAMTEGIATMSEGTVLDVASVRGIAGAFSALPIFKDDPKRTFRTMQTLDQTFRQGDRFQQAMAARAVIATAGGANATPANIEIRKDLGLFFGGEKGTDLADRMRKVGGEKLANVLTKATPEKLIDTMFKQSMEQTKGLNFGQQAYEFMNRTGMKNVEGLEIFTAQKEGGKLTPKQIEKFKKAQMDPQERLLETFSGLDKNMKVLGEQIASSQEKAAEKISTGITTMTGILEKILTVNMASNLGLGAMAVTALASLTGGAGVGKAASTVGNVIGKGGTLARGAGKLAKGAGIVGVAAMALDPSSIGSKAKMPKNSTDAMNLLYETPQEDVTPEQRQAAEKILGTPENNFEGYSWPGSIPEDKRTSSVLNAPPGFGGTAPPSGQSSIPQMPDISGSLDLNKTSLDKCTTSIVNLTIALSKKGVLTGKIPSGSVSGMRVGV